MNLPARIQSWRRARAKTQRDVADKVGVTVGAVSLWESGQSSPTVAHLEALIKYLAGTHTKFYGDIPKAVERAS